MHQQILQCFQSGNNKISTIRLFGIGNVNTVIGASGEDSFIKVITNAAIVIEDKVGTQANYVEITGTCVVCEDLPSNVNYVEVKSPECAVWITTIASTLTSLTVDEGYSLNISGDREVTNYLPEG